MFHKEKQLNIIGSRKIWFGLSSILVIGSLLSIFIGGLKLGIDFTGGSLMEIQTTDQNTTVSATYLEELISTNVPEVPELKIQSTSEEAAGEGVSSYLIRTSPLTEDQHQQILHALEGGISDVSELRFESVGPTIGLELRDKAFEALIVAIIVIILYIAWSFRKVSEPVASWKYGLSAIVALIHDVVIVTGVFALISRVSDFQIDALFVTALLVTLGYSVNDTIVVFDRIRENVLRAHISSFETLVNKSVNETISRSINTSLTTLLVLLTMYFFGGASIQGFVLTLVLGIVIGTYSSIFLASPILVTWEKLRKK